MLDPITTFWFSRTNVWSVNLETNINSKQPYLEIKTNNKIPSYKALFFNIQWHIFEKTLSLISSTSLQILKVLFNNIRPWRWKVPWSNVLYMNFPRVIININILQTSVKSSSSWANSINNIGSKNNTSFWIYIDLSRHLPAES